MIARIICGDVREVLPTLPDASIQCCVTSPPYWGLRDYGTARWDGGDPACDHIERIPSRGKSTLTSAGVGQTDEGAAYQAQRRQYADTCGKCAAVRIDSQLGLERTPQEYVAKMVAVFREVRRVLRDDGVLWLNLGDSYAAGKCGRDDQDEESLRRRFADYGTGRPKAGRTGNNGKQRDVPEGLKPKDLVGIPWRVAFALQEDGWYLRSDCIWAKPNPMPESVTDRPTKAHEYLFLLTKSERYFYDLAAIAEKSVCAAGTAGTWDGNRDFGLPGGAPRFEAPNLGGSIDGTRNKRTVWTIATQPFEGAHFAVMPEALAEPCILAGSREGDIVLDPFAGSGTVGVVALKNGRSFLGVELNPKYAAMARERIVGDAPLFNRAEVA